MPSGPNCASNTRVCARWHVPQTLSTACFDVVITGLTQQGPPSVRIVSNAIEAPRLRDTEFVGTAAEFDVVEWYEDRASRLPVGEHVGTDVPDPGRSDLSGPIAGLRRVLTPRQRGDLAALCRDAAAVGGRVARSARPGQSEQGIAGTLLSALTAAGMECIAVFVGSDERISAHRHPLPTSKSVQDRLMIAFCARRYGLVASVTRMVSFTALKGQAERYASLLSVERAFLDASVPGKGLDEAFLKGIPEYRLAGFDRDEWHRHHQGGITGFSPRELIAHPGTDALLQDGMILGWNPSAAGFKVEDTTLVTARGAQPLAADPEWPSVRIGGRTRPSVLEY